jgi:histidyl-tRNA synthetase
MDPSPRSPKAQFKVADREKASFTVVVGDNELAAGQVKVKNMTSGEEKSVARGEVVQALR